MLECDIEIILKSFTELLTVFLIFPHSGDSSSHLGIGLVHTGLKGFVERCSCSFEVLDSAGTSWRFLSEDSQIVRGDFGDFLRVSCSTVRYKSAYEQLSQFC